MSRTPTTDFFSQPSVNNENLFSAIDKNQLDEVRRILQMRASSPIDLNYRTLSGDGDPLLVHALNLGYVRIARELIQAGSDVNLGNTGAVREKHTTKTPLTRAILCELAASSDTNHPKDEKDKKSASGIVQLLITKGANVNHISRAGSTPLQTLVFYRTMYRDKAIELFQLLTSNGANEHSISDEYRAGFQELKEAASSGMSLHR